MTRISHNRGKGRIAWCAAVALLACHAPRAVEPEAPLATATFARSSEAVSTTGLSTVFAPPQDTTSNTPVKLAIAPEDSRPLPRESHHYSKAIAIVANLRGWPRLSALAIDEASTEELGLWLATEFEAQMPSSVARLQDHSLSLLGLLPPKFDSSAAVLEFFVDTIPGAYLSTRSRIFLRRGLPPESARVALTHEVVHAYQDQLYALGSKLLYQSSNGDSVAALHALAEGEASHVELEVARSDLGSADGDFSDEQVEKSLTSLSSRVALPNVLRRSLVAPYRDGYRFVSYLRRVGNWELVDAVWRRGLTNTAELLHPERWVDARAGLAPRSHPKPPAELRAAVVAGDSELVWEESLGEQGLRILLEETEPAERAAALASGWHDDTFWLIRSQAGERLAWHLRTESAAQATVLTGALRRLLYGSGKAPSTCLVLDAANVALMAQNRDILVVASGKVDAGFGQRPKLPCAELVGWGRSALPRISVTN